MDGSDERPTILRTFILGWKELRRLRKTKEPTTWKEMKKGMAAGEPQLPSSCVQCPEVSSIIASAIMEDQPSPVRHWKRRRKEEPKEIKLR